MHKARMPYYAPYVTVSPLGHTEITGSECCNIWLRCVCTLFGR